MAWLPIQAVTLWDLHVLRRLEIWQRDAGREVRAWFDAVGELEALAALAALHHDHPRWCFPELVDDPRVIAEDLGHPLLPPASCVANDVSLGPPGTFLLVTGSNMSGKSTLLRAIGANAVLAHAGGPVCASRMQLPLLILGTSFRVQDSLADGVSYFMAELRRLKEVVDRAASVEDDRVLLFLLDEILLGTNVAERQIAVQQVLGQLVEHRALGAVATHDLSLADAEGLAERCQPIHFTETFFRDDDGPQMTFDYRARAGVSPTTNALKLLELVGLDRRR
jgi:DNA mismatch repair ATPase MutS